MAPNTGAPQSRTSNLNSVLGRNIEALRRKQIEDQEKAALSSRLADRVTAFTGSMIFVAIHLVIVALWIACNLGWIPAVEPFDPTFVILATAASVEAIFLSTFVLISQNRAAAAAEQRANLDLQTSLLAEYEVTRMLTLVKAIAQHLGIDAARDPELSELESFVAPEKVLEEIERAEEG